MATFRGGGAFRVEVVAMGEMLRRRPVFSLARARAASVSRLRGGASVTRDVAGGSKLTSVLVLLHMVLLPSSAEGDMFRVGRRQAGSGRSSDETGDDRATVVGFLERLGFELAGA